MAYFDKIEVSDGTLIDVQDTIGRQLADDNLAKTQKDIEKTIDEKIAVEAENRVEGDNELRKRIDYQVGNLAETYINVKKYGAIGDGVSDDTEAILTCVKENSGKGIYFPSGIYIIKSTIIAPDKTSFIGDSENSVIKASKDFTGNCLLQTRYWSPLNVNNEDYGYIQLYNIAFDGNYRDNYTNTGETGAGTWDGLHLGGNGIILNNVSVVNMPFTGVCISNNRTSGYAIPRAEPLFSNVTIKYNGQHGLYVMHGSKDGEYVNCIIASNSMSQNNSYVNLVFHEADATGHFTNCRFYSDYGDTKTSFAVYIPKDGATVRFTNCDFSGGRNSNLNCGGYNCIYTNCNFFDTFGSSQLYLDTAALFVGCQFWRQSGDGVPSDKGNYYSVVTVRNTNEERLNDVEFIGCRLNYCDVPFIADIPVNSNNWTIDLNGSSNTNPLNTSNIPSSWRVNWCGSFPTSRFKDSNS